MIQIERFFGKQFLLIWLVNFTIFMAFQILIPTIPLYASETFSADSIVGLIVGLFTISAVLIRPVSSFLLELKNRRIYILVGLLLFGILAYSYFWISSLWLFFIFRIFHGASWGFSTTGTSTVASYLIPLERASEGMGYFTLSQNIAMAIGPALGLFIVSRYSFHSLFANSFYLSIIAFLIMLFFKEKQRVIDKKSGKKKFVIIEKKVLIPSLILFFTTVVQGAIVSFLPLYALKRDIEQIGIYFTVFAIVLVVMRPFVGRFADKKGSFNITLVSIVSIMMVLFLLYNMQSSLDLILAALFWGFGFGTIHPLMQACAIRLAPDDKEKANGTILTFFDAGIAVGAMVGGIIANVFNYSAIFLSFMIFPLIARVILVNNKKIFSQKSE
ncbi:MAG: MFS transporter [Clostridia bacterium]|nr:MFS transporter [Clostridia bacterium]